MYLITVCGVDLYSTDNFLDFITQFKYYQSKFGIDSVTATCTNECVSTIPSVFTLNVNVRLVNDGQSQELFKKIQK